MRKCFIAAICAVGALGVGTTATPALTVTGSPGGLITATSLGKLSFASSFGSLQCNVTLTGSLARSATLVGSLTSVGSVTGGSTANCTLAGIAILPFAVNSLPWQIALTSTTSMANRLITILGMTFFDPSTGCAYTGNVGTTVNGTNTTAATLLLLLTSTLSGGAVCGNDVLAGGFGVTPSQTIAFTP
jgi:hypothetical protein